MDTMEQLVQRVQRTQHGFLDIQRAADEVVAGHSAEESLHIARQLFASDMHQARALATFIFGQLAASSQECLQFLKLHVSKDSDWRVQEILAQALSLSR